MRFALYSLALVCMGALGFSASAQFLDLDPTLDWSVLSTEHFNIVYHEGLESIAQEAALVSEEAFQFWVRELKYTVPFQINIILADPSDFAVGAANPFGDVIASVSNARVFNEWLNPQNPSWLDDVLYHEIGHVFDIMKASGLSESLRPWLGPVLTLNNSSKPGTLIEGIPIYFEFKRSGASRSNSSRDAMYLRAEVLENRFTRLDQMGVGYGYDPPHWPSGYMLAHDWGAWFARFIVERYGDDALVKIDEINADSLLPILTFGAINDFGSVFKRALGVSGQELEQAWRDWLKVQFEPQIEKIKSEGVTTSRKLSRLEYWNNDPAWSPDGKFIYYYHKDRLREAAIRRIRPDGGEDQFVFVVPFELEFFRPPFFAPAPQISPDGTSVLYTRHEIFDNRYVYADLYLWDLEKKEERRLTERARAYNPVFFHDGTKILFAQQRPDGRAPMLAVYELGTERIVPFYEFPDGTLIDSFAISPDGTKIALTLWKMGGYQDLYLLTADGSQLTALTQDKPGDFDPDWSPDGQYILFSSERDGVYNLYAYRVSDGQFFKVTNVLTGAFAPAVSPDGTKIAFISYSTKGYELHIMDYDPHSWKPVQLARESIPEWAGWRTGVLTAKPYNAKDFLAPRLWVPIPNPVQPAVLLVGFDPLGHHDYAFYAGLDSPTRQPVLAFDYSMEFALKGRGWFAETVNSLSPRFIAHLEHTAASESIVRGEIELTTSRIVGRMQTLAFGAQLRQAEQLTLSFLVRYRESLEGGGDLLRIGRDLEMGAQFALTEGSRWKMRLQIRQQESMQLPLGFENRLSRLTVLARDDFEPLSVGGLGELWSLRGFPKDFVKRRR
uniref:Periplasmic component of the Tol biopolymer transport system n=1 Tax=Acetithermum autotrophicum TaxID=1446466 RepID=H5SSI6_ACEAU|nr:periplasmic component of the Tol biopolymer transport system [Candidatus Acetothermum autotrophicum]